MKAKKTNSGTRKAGSAAAVFNIKSILVPIDFSSPSRTALDHACQLARKFRATLSLVHVVEPVATADFAASFPLALENEARMASAKSELLKCLRGAGIPKSLQGGVVVRFGRSFHEIVDVARARKVDLIVISTHGYTGWKHALMGSTTERVVRHAACPVLVLRER